MSKNNTKYANNLSLYFLSELWLCRGEDAKHRVSTELIFLPFVETLRTGRLRNEAAFHTLWLIGITYTPNDLTTSIDNILNGDFIKIREERIYKNLFLRMDKVITKSFDFLDKYKE